MFMEKLKNRTFKKISVKTNFNLYKKLLVQKLISDYQKIIQTDS